MNASVRVVPNLRKLVIRSPLGKRAWVFQEMILARRVVHFTESQSISMQLMSSSILHK